MRDIQPMTHGALVVDDLDAALNGLRVGAVYTAADLYSRYEDAARAAGRTPAHPVALGQALKIRGHRRVKKRVGGGGRGHQGQGRQVSAWQLT